MRMTVLVLMLITLLLIMLPASGVQQPSLSYLYKLGDNGVASVTIIVSRLTGIIEYSIHVYEEVINESLVAFDEQGNIVLATYNGTHITIYPMNTTDKVIIQYEAIAGHVTVEGLIQVNLTVHGTTTIILPEGAGLIYFSGNPEVEIIGETIKLRYSEPGIIQLEYIPPIPITTPPPSPTTSPTTTPTPTQTLTTETTPTSTPSPTTSPSPVPTTSSPSLTTTPSPSPITTPTTSPSPTTTPSPTTPTATSTTTVQPAPTFPTIVIVFIVIIIVLLIGGIILYKTKFSKTYFSTPSFKPLPPSTSGKEVEFLEHGKLDERDKLILSKLSKKSMSISELARELGLSKSTVWRRVRKLEKQGYVKTREEGKKTIIELTEKARMILDRGV
ncbi:hypothetical protein DRJ17_07035 [Candidatus Woesearchaeota archaeon]|nr:MAG: hypothetical protein DRJ17_07035 [Candidatus Woesearchaeota archaeon]